MEIIGIVVRYIWKYHECKEMKVSTYGGKPDSPDHNAQGYAAAEAEDAAMEGEATHSGDQRPLAPSTQVRGTMPPPATAVKGGGKTWKPKKGS